MTWGWIGAAAITVIGGAINNNQQKQAAKGAANAQAAAANAGIKETRTQFEQIRDLLAPFVESGRNAVTAQNDILGTNGPEAQKKALDQLKMSPQFSALTQQGENAILQNASATGGLRGGNTQGALAQFRPQMLSQLIDQQYNRLGQQAQLGQAAAAGQASAGLQTGMNTATLLGNVGNAQAGQYIANAQANQNFTNSAFGALSTAYGGYGKANGWF